MTPGTATTVDAMKAAARDWGLAVLAGAVMLTVYGLLQPRMTLQEGLAWDATHYFSLAQQFRQGADPVVGPRPFAYRVGTAWIAAALPLEDLRDGFLTANLAFTAGTYLLLVGWLRRLAPGRVLPIGLAVLLLMHHQTLRLTYYYPVLTDPAAIFFSLLILSAGLRRADWRWWDALAVAAATFIGVLFRETVLLAPACLAAAALVVPWAPWRTMGRRALLRAIPVAAGVAGVWATHQWIQAEPTPYSFSHAVRWSWNTNTTHPLQFLLAVVLNTGVLIYIPLVCARYFRVLRDQTHLALWTYALGIIALAFVGGWHTDRFVSWGVIAYLPLVGVAAHGLLNEPLPRWKPMLLLVPVTAAHLLMNRVWLAIPDVSNHQLYVLPDQGEIHRVWFAVFGQDLSLWHFHSVSMFPELRVQIAVQCLWLAVYAAAVGAWLWWEASRRRAGREDPP